MCGICGYAGLEPNPELLQRMTRSISHRGPDEDGFWVQDRVGLGMRRLSIIDVAGGHQPIFNEDGTLAIIFNGEIYNYQTLMEDLQARGHRFKTKCDTETILHLYEEYGVECLQHLRGMFAIAIYDAARQRLFLARDRLGIKPLYYWAKNGTLLFGSEIKALLEHEGVERAPYLPAIDSYLTLRYVPGHATLFQDIYKLPAAHWMTWEAGTCHQERYWQPPHPPEQYQPDEYYEQGFDELFREAVRLRMISEVPLGGFLSGGVDSTAIVTTMSQLVEKRVQTFSVGFGWAGDELELVRQAAPHLPIDSHEVICRPQDMELLPKIVWHLDEPVGDAIVLPMYLLSRLARQHVTVVLSGEGADEMLAGYFPHRVMDLAHRLLHPLPNFLLKGILPKAVQATPTALLNTVFDYPATLGQRGKLKLLDYLKTLRQPSAEYHFLLSLLDERDKNPLYTAPMHLHKWQPASTNHLPSQPYLDRLLHLQFAHWLPDDILTKQDKMSMANSIEARVPFLDHKLVEFLMQTPPHLKLGLRQNKKLLRRYLNQHLDHKIAKRRKKAFYIPLEQYFKTPVLQELVQDCLAEKRVRQRGYFQWEQVRWLRDSVGQGDFLYGKQVLALVMLELWHRIFIDRETGWGIPA